MNLTPEDLEAIGALFNAELNSKLSTFKIELKNELKNELKTELLSEIDKSFKLVNEILLLKIENMFDTFKKEINFSIDKLMSTNNNHESRISKLEGEVFK